MLKRVGKLFPFRALGRQDRVVSAVFHRRLWPLAVGVMVLNVAGCGFTLAPPGFVRETRHGISRARIDHNTFRRFSLSFERYDHLPPESARVKLFRWSHGGSVDKPPIVPFPEEVILTEGTFEHTGPEGSPFQQPPIANESPQDTGKGTMEYVPPPLAPPSEIEEPRFPPLEMEPAEDPLDGLVRLSFSEMEEADETPLKQVPQHPADCNVPMGDTGNKPAE